MTDGCPDDYNLKNDRDLDGIPDAIDVCPTAKETWNRFQDDDGCPDYLVDNKLTSDSDI